MVSRQKEEVCRFWILNQAIPWSELLLLRVKKRRVLCHARTLLQVGMDVRCCCHHARGASQCTLQHFGSWPSNPHKMIQYTLIKLVQTDILKHRLSTVCVGLSLSNCIHRPWSVAWRVPRCSKAGTGNCKDRDAQHSEDQEVAGVALQG